VKSPKEVWDADAELTIEYQTEPSECVPVSENILTVSARVDLTGLGVAREKTLL
jgi:hypothetical protein